MVIGEAAFSDCAKLDNIVLNNVRTIERRAFYCDVISKRNDGRVVTRILSGAFSRCPAIDVNVGEGINEIEDGAFEGNAAMLYADLPDSLQKLGADSFKVCKRLVNVSLPERFKATPHNYRLLRQHPFPAGAVGAADKLRG